MYEETNNKHSYSNNLCNLHNGGGVQPLIASAESCSDELQYGDYLFYQQVDEDEDGTYDYVEITDCDESVTEIEIPDEIDGLPVTSIGDYAFSTNLESITIPDSVASIEYYAFIYCSGLKNIKIGSGVTSIEYGAFWRCSSLASIYVSEKNMNYCSIDGVLFNKDKTELIQYPIGNERTEYNIPDSVTSIENGAFLECASLENITIPDSVTSIGNSAFGECTSLASITIPDSVTSIGYGAFWRCSSLASIYVSEKNMNYCSIDGVLFNKDKTELIQYPIGNERTEYNIPDSVTSIENGAFLECASLENITIPDSVTSIGNSAFGECTSLESIIIPDSVTSIGQDAFYKCTSLESITIEDPECEIYDDASTISNVYGAEYEAYFNGTIYGYENSTAQA
ncbi:MAG: leucine-rich repeat domain-containing protein, partial [Porcipelethomonas sp.]